MRRWCINGKCGKKVIRGNETFSNHVWVYGCYVCFRVYKIKRGRKEKHVLSRYLELYTGKDRQLYSAGFKQWVQERRIGQKRVVKIASVVKNGTHGSSKRPKQ